MPPKLPFMKFKPRADTRAPKEVKAEEDEPAGVSTFQQQRLQQQQTVQTAQAGVTGPQGTAAAAAAGSSSTMAGGAKGATGKAGGDAPRAARGTFTVSAPIASGSTHSSVIIPTETLGPNTADNVRNFVDPTTDDWRFLPMQGAPVLTESPLVDVKPEEEKEAGKKEKAQPVSGTAFLMQHREEAENQFSQNQTFFSGVAEDLRQAEGASPAKLMWFQLPAAQTAGGAPRADGRNPSKEVAPSLAEQRPGKIGKLRVRRSGKTELVINDMVYEVVLENQRSHASISQEVVAIVPSPSGDGSTVCYELGKVDRKAICIAVPSDE